MQAGMFDGPFGAIHYDGYEVHEDHRTGGVVTFPDGQRIRWQNSLLDHDEDGNPSQNGITVEDLLLAVLHRLEWFQDGPHRSRETAVSITNIETGWLWLKQRFRNRVSRGVFNTYKR